MWLGLILVTEDEADDVDQDMAILVAYDRDRLFSAGAPLAMAPQLARMLCQAGREAGTLTAPRCGTCGEPLDVPPLDDMEPACVSA